MHKEECVVIDYHSVSCTYHAWQTKPLGVTPTRFGRLKHVCDSPNLCYCDPIPYFSTSLNRVSNISDI